MTDNITPEQRLRCMSRIKSNETKPEMLLRRALWKEGLRYRVCYKLPGKPDLVFVSARLVVFVDGCFWHGCPLHGTWPKSNTGYWQTKLAKNISRDQITSIRLADMGWRVVRFWEHEVEKDTENVVMYIRQILKK